MLKNHSGQSDYYVGSVTLTSVPMLKSIVCHNGTVTVTGNVGDHAAISATRIVLQGHIGKGVRLSGTVQNPEQLPIGTIVNGKLLTASANSPEKAPKKAREKAPGAVARLFQPSAQIDSKKTTPPAGSAARKP